MILKGLPEEYKAICTVVTQQKEDQSFIDFKAAHRSYENAKSRRPEHEAIKDANDFYRETCVQEKMTEYRTRVPDYRAVKPLQLIHSDLAGPITPVSNEGSKYVISFIDDYSGVVHVYFFRRKSDAAAAATERFIADVASYGSIKRFRCDNDTEYTPKKFRSLLNKNRIKKQFSAQYSPYQNDTAERNWRSLFEMARCMLLEANLPKTLWNYAVWTAAYIRNRCYNPKLHKTPYEAFIHAKPNVSNFHKFGMKCHAHVENKTELDARSEKGTIILYDLCSPAYLVCLKKMALLEE
ncbi:Integrase catalytic core [Trinorchestia longiramus]|nr:Integrase catalytic core [Trinorchestia longiramus]